MLTKEPIQQEGPGPARYLRRNEMHQRSVAFHLKALRAGLFAATLALPLALGVCCLSPLACH